MSVQRITSPKSLTISCTKNPQVSKPDVYLKTLIELAGSMCIDPIIVVKKEKSSHTRQQTPTCSRIEVDIL